MIFAGIDVGGRRKGFHGAAIDEKEVVAGPERLADVEAVMSWLEPLDPARVAVDSPRTYAPTGEASRSEERALMSEICGVRFTPEESQLEGNRYYEWIVCGRELYTALERDGSSADKVIEVFPTASWTLWAGSRNKRGRAAWTREALERMALAGLPSRRLNQDDRDAVAAALTARLDAQGLTTSFGEIILPANTGITDVLLGRMAERLRHGCSR